MVKILEKGEIKKIKEFYKEELKRLESIVDWGFDAFEGIAILKDEEGNEVGALDLNNMIEEHLDSEIARIENALKGLEEVSK